MYVITFYVYASYHGYSAPDIALSLCGGLEDSDVPTDKFLQHLITYQQFCEKPNLMADPNLVIRIADK